MADSSRASRSRKSKSDRPKKPFADFSLTPHASGAWMKKIGGRIFYFGRWARTVNGKLERLPDDGWREALELYKAQADDLHAGRTPRLNSDSLSVGGLCNRYLTFKSHRLDSGEINRRTFDEYRQSCDRIVAHFGKERLVDDIAADDFGALRAEMAAQWGPVKLAHEIQAVRSLFKFAFDEGLIDRPVRFGQQFNKPSAAVLRKHRAKNGKKLLTAEELRLLIDAAPPHLRAMVLLGLNAGFGPHDCATLPIDAIDFREGFISYACAKTGVERRCPLWPETQAALKAALVDRPNPKTPEAADLVFVTTRGRPFLCRGIANPISVAIRELMKAVGIHRPGIGAYTFRHIFRTVADATKDFPAIRQIMGHSDGGSIDGVYIKGIDDERLQAVSDHMRRWLFGDDPEAGRDIERDETADAAAPESVDSQSDDRPLLRIVG